MNYSGLARNLFRPRIFVAHRYSDPRDHAARFKGIQIYRSRNKPYPYGLH
jgi:hypothetical protein